MFLNDKIRRNKRGVIILNKVEYMFIGVHPDDIEIGCGGIVSKVSKNKDVILVDLTAGEMGSNGNREIRKNESEEASKILGAKFRINLEFDDTNLKDNEITIMKIVNVIRKYRPEVIIYPYSKDYHPDHEFGSYIIKKSIFKSGLVKYETKYEKYRPRKSYCYYINDIENPTFFVDISDDHIHKIEALKAHKSQFITNESTNITYLNSGFIEDIVARDRYFGSNCGCEYAEPLYSGKLLLLKDLDFLG